MNFYVENQLVNNKTKIFYFKSFALINALAVLFIFVIIIFPTNSHAAQCEEISFSELSPTEANSFEIAADGIIPDDDVLKIWFKVGYEKEIARFYAPQKTEEGTNKLNFNTENLGGKFGIYYITVYAEYPASKGGLKALKTRGIEVVKEVTKTYIMGKSETDPEQMVKYFKDSGFEYPEYYEQNPRGVTLEEFARMYFEICETEGVRAEAAWVQMCLETGYLNFSNLVENEQFNFAGLGATGPGFPGFDFSEEYGNDYDGIRAGIIGHVQHLKCYASDEGVNILFEGEPYDPRWNDYLREASATLERLEGNWAVSAGYGMDLARSVEKLLNTE